jgi:hypothetical protein
MKAKILIYTLPALILATIHLAEAQEPANKIPLVGVFLPDTAASYQSYTEAFRQGLRELGYVIGQNIILEYRYADGKRDRFAGLAAELVLK